MRSPLSRRLDALEKVHGRKKGPPPRGAFELVLWENVVYLADDDTRGRAFALLKKTVGIRPADILGASSESLHRVASLGRMPELRVEALRSCARIAAAMEGGDLDRALTLPAKETVRILRKFPSIGEPGAEKIRLFTRTEPVFALESNGLRVLLRLGYGREQQSYTATYRSVREAAAKEIAADCEALVRAHLLLKAHGQEVCRRSAPSCEICPLEAMTEGCRFFDSLALRPKRP